MEVEQVVGMREIEVMYNWPLNNDYFFQTLKPANGQHTRAAEVVVRVEAVDMTLGQGPVGVVDMVLAAQVVALTSVVVVGVVVVVVCPGGYFLPYVCRSIYIHSNKAMLRFGPLLLLQSDQSIMFAENLKEGRRHEIKSIIKWISV